MKIKSKTKDLYPLFLIFLVVGFLCFALECSAEKTINWYCVRAKDNLQPTADESIRFVEEYNGYYIDKEHGDSNCDKVVYLTFDVGYENGNVSKILDVLHEEEVPAAFFILGNVIEKNPELILRMVNDGHIVGNHTDKHKNMATILNEDSFLGELKRLEDKFLHLTGKDLSKYFRPPEGKFNHRTMEYASKNGYKTIFWSFAYADWDNNNQPNREKAMNKIMSNIHNGAVILLHPTSETNAAIMRDLIVKLKELGYRFGTLDDLCGEGEV